MPILVTLIARWYDNRIGTYIGGRCRSPDVDEIAKPDLHFYSVEYLDGDGDPVIQHGLLTEAEAKELIEKFARAGVTASVNRLSGPPRDAVVSLPDVDRLLDEMGRPDPGVVR